MGGTGVSVGSGGRGSPNDFCKSVRACPKVSPIVI